MRKLALYTCIAMLALTAAACGKKNAPGAESSAAEASASNIYETREPYVDLTEGTQTEPNKMSLNVSARVKDGYTWKLDMGSNDIFTVEKTGEEVSDGFAVGTFDFTAVAPGEGEAVLSYQREANGGTMMIAKEKVVHAVVNDNMEISYTVNEDGERRYMTYYEDYEDLRAAAQMEPLRYNGDDYQEVSYIYSQDGSYGVTYESDYGMFILYTSDEDSDSYMVLADDVKEDTINSIGVTIGSSEDTHYYVVKWYDGITYHNAVYSGAFGSEFLEKTVPELVHAAQ